MERDGQPLEQAELWRMTPTGMSIRQPRLAVPDPETGVWVDVGLTLMPEYWFREAARFAGYRWREFTRLKPRDAIATVAHWMAHGLFNQHTQDAHALESERRQRLAEARAAVGRRN